MRSRRPSAAALLCLLVVVAACAAPPQPAAPPSAPTPASLPACAGVAGAGSDIVAAASADATTSTVADGADDLVLVALDDEGRPEFVPTDVASAADDTRALSSEPGLDVVGLAVDRPVSIAGAATPTAAASPTAGDPHRAQQWALDHLGIDTLRSRSRGQGIDVAVIDTGVAAGHVDLGATSCSGVAFLENSGVAQAGKGAQDPHGHGTHVAGIVAATTGNGRGTAGVAPSARIIPVRVLGSNGNGWSSDVARGITWAVDHGAEVINLSLGGGHAWPVEVAVDYA
ncbi:S8 family serine peptidase, partial [Tolypothrix campylonemoides VB511288]